ncbi:MarR family winged helix-turn-helix transcriptional regulator [Pseudonocardia sp. ICBG1034]|uniref:MarR family winged helix-turn-helix transcriptional regulator n=1 Tax=Pseudonocardia sp. ICBG1034 TaxID=2844381 RepID=UPI001CCF1726|nr:MarR family transcriptional regulator [Pseudonocardia sp. ICBG1034]
MSAAMDGGTAEVQPESTDGFDAIDRVEQDWRRERPDIDVSPMGIVSRIWRIGRHLEQHRKSQLLAFGSDRGTIDVLGMLRRSGPPYRRSAGELTRSSLITSGGVSQRLDKLEKAGFVTRHVDVNDRRRVDVELTPVGVELVDGLLSGLMDRDAQVLAQGLTPAEQRRLRALLRKLLLSLEPHDSEG